MTSKLENDIYATLIGVIDRKHRVPGVENAFAPGEYCDRMYEKMLDYRERLLLRLGVEEDEDIEGMLVCMNSIEVALCTKMFEYGVKFADQFR